MLEGIAIGGGVGLLAVVSTFIMHYVLLRASQGQTDRATDRAHELAKRLDTSHEDIAELEKQAAVFTTNERELKRELEANRLTIAQLEARVVSIQKAKDDLAKVLHDNPGALPAAVRSAFDGLRQAVSPGEDPQAAAPGDPDRGKAGAVHEAADVGASRR